MITCKDTAFLKAKETGVTYAELVKRMDKLGFKETEASITMKLKRGASPRVSSLLPLLP
jgi:hypothetical protein